MIENELGDQGAIIISGMMMTNTSLTNLSVSGEDFYGFITVEIETLDS